MADLTREEFEALYARSRQGIASEDDLRRLEPYRVKRAVLLAGGYGSRMLPITINTPKPLVNVGGRKLIETLLDALLAIDVTEIYIVVGHLKECFEPLKHKYPTIELLYNPLYKTTNDISSACVAADYFKNAYVFESDLLLRNPRLLEKYHYESCYLGVPVEETSDWCFDMRDDGYIADFHEGGTACYHAYGVSYWTEEDGARLASDLRKWFKESEEARRLPWDKVPCVYCRDRYQVRVKECSFDDIVEIDSLAELQALDSRYQVACL